jgi:ABC-type multidrug transport system ATPase subunit
MLLVLGRTGSGCSTFLKTIALQTEAYSSITGAISYGGYSPKEIQECNRSHVVYNQGEILHYQDTLTFRK